MSSKSNSKDSLNANASSKSNELANAENPDSSSAENSVKRMGVVRFLQIVSQKSGTAAILRSRYASQIHTQQEWEEVVAKILNRKVK